MYISMALVTLDLGETATDHKVRAKSLFHTSPISYVFIKACGRLSR